jgi:hypothetical protein
MVPIEFASEAAGTRFLGCAGRLARHFEPPERFTLKVCIRCPQPVAGSYMPSSRPEKPLPNAPSTLRTRGVADLAGQGPSDFGRPSNSRGRFGGIAQDRLERAW